MRLVLRQQITLFAKNLLMIEEVAVLKCYSFDDYYNILFSRSNEI